MRVVPRRWLALTMLGALLLVALAACSSTKAQAVTIPSASSGDVTLTLDRTSYKDSQPIGVTVKNTSKKITYYATDGHTACTFLQLEQYVPATKGWVAVSNCSNSQQPLVRMLPANADEPFTLAPGNVPNDPNRWQTGLYRVSLTMSTQPDVTGKTITAYSAGFLIG